MDKKHYIKPVVVLSLVGIIINVILVGLTNRLQLPIYVDSVGTIIAAALGGLLPGIIVGFSSNCLGTLIKVSADPMTMYYAFISVLIAATTVYYSKKGFLIRWKGRIIVWISYALIGGGIGSVVTWVLYGFSYGQGATLPIVSIIDSKFDMPPFLVQVITDLGMDFLDKIVVICIVCFMMKLISVKIYEKLPLGNIYVCWKNKKNFNVPKKKTDASAKTSVNLKITLWTVISTSVISIVAVAVGGSSYYNDIYKQFKTECNYVSQMMNSKINGGHMLECLENGSITNGYLITRKDIRDIVNNQENVIRMNLLQMQQDGMHVICSVEKDAQLNLSMGDVLPYGNIEKYKDSILNETEIENYIIQADDGDGNKVMKIYAPVKNMIGNIVAYSEVVMDMNHLKTNLAVFMIRIISMLFGLMLIISIVTIWVCNRFLLRPIGILAEQARMMVYDGERKGKRVRELYSINTGDELEEVFRVMCHTEDQIASHMIEIKEKNHEISKMQRNIIYALANMVENRDGNTGGHIKRTANYVRLIGRNMIQNNIYADIVNEQYVKQLYDSAPLHDIGKIKIPDSILNKPGKFTDEEFEIMKSHTIEGRNILKKSLGDIEDDSWMTMAISMAMYHHEKWNGKGYPEGLKEDQIPLCARIMAVADVFDALVSVRSYKKAFSFEEAINIIKESAGEHFDPQIVEAFVYSKEEITNIMKQSE